MLRTKILCIVDRVSQYIPINKTNFIHYLSSVYFMYQPVHVSDVFIAHHQEVHHIYIYIYNNGYLLFSKYQLLYIYVVPPDDGL
jgi:hypothetical protein